jgi:hypothetical protein
MTTATKLTPAQARTYAEITEAPTTTPDKVYCGAFFLANDWSDTTVIDGKTLTVRYNGNRVYGRFNSSTLRVLEAKGLIRVHFDGGSHRSDEIEILAHA